MEECKAAARTLESLRDCYTKRSIDDRAGCVHPPLLNIELCYVVADELHLLLRISDKLISNLVLQMAALDHASRVHRQASATSHMDQLVAAIRSCGIHFSVRQNIITTIIIRDHLTAMLLGIGLAQERC